MEDGQNLQLVSVLPEGDHFINRFLINRGSGFWHKVPGSQDLSMDPADPSLDVVLQGIPHNMDWNLEDPLAHGYHTAGLKRFDLSYLRAHQTKQTTVEKKETLSATQWASKAKVSLEDEPPEQQATIKFEFPMHASLKAIVPVPPLHERTLDHAIMYVVILEGTPC